MRKTMTSNCKQKDDDSYNAFSATALLLALAPQALVLQVWRREQQQERDNQGTVNQGTVNQGTVNQGTVNHASFAAWTQSHLHATHAPPQRYLTHLVRLYMQDNSNSNDTMEDDDDDEDLMALYGVLHGTTRAVPDAMECGYATYTIPIYNNNNNNNNNNSKDKKDKKDNTVPLCIRIYPYHSDVSLRLWEAGAALAEYLVHQGQALGTVVELGAGVGATALCLAATGLADRVVATDFTSAALDNMRHNFDLQQNSWLQQTTDTCHGSVMAAHLDWNDYGNNDNDTDNNKTDNHHHHNHHSHPDATLIEQEMTKANLLIAADVAYDTTVLPALARTVKRFLTTATTATNNNHQQPSKRALFATTRRNAATFQQLQDLLVKQQGLTCQTVVTPETKPPAILFPTKFHQARHEVALWLLTYDKAQES